MTSNGIKATANWQASVAWCWAYPRHLEETEDGEWKPVSLPITLFYVVIERGEDERLQFSVSWPLPHRRLVFSDSRECFTGISGSTGLWGTRPRSKPGGKRRMLTPTAWKAEVRRFIGDEEADRIIRFLLPGRPAV